MAVIVLAVAAAVAVAVTVIVVVEVDPWSQDYPQEQLKHNSKG
jgi:hypothetical protein